MGCHFRQTGPFAGAGKAMLDRVHLPPGTLDHIRRRGGCLCRYQDGVQFIVDRLRHLALVGFDLIGDFEVKPVFLQIDAVPGERQDCPAAGARMQADLDE